MFCNHEETPVYPMYIDPIHDFGYAARRHRLGSLHRSSITLTSLMPTPINTSIMTLVGAPRSAIT